jgi:hypothetical protein
MSPRDSRRVKQPTVMRDLARIPWKPMEAAESAVYYRVRLRSNSGSFAVSIWFGSVGCPIPDK